MASESWRPALRLRHLQSVTLHGLDPGGKLEQHALLFYELRRLLPDGDQQLVYVSEQVPLDYDLCWQPLDVAGCNVAAASLHQPLADPLRLTIKAAVPAGAQGHTAEAEPPALAPALLPAQALATTDARGGEEQHVAEQHVTDIQLPELPADPQQQQKQQQQQEKLVYVRLVDGVFRVLLPHQLQLLHQQPQQVLLSRLRHMNAPEHVITQQQQQPTNVLQGQPREADSGAHLDLPAAPQELLSSEASVAATAIDDRPVRVLLDQNSSSVPDAQHAATTADAVVGHGLQQLRLEQQSCKPLQQAPCEEQLLLKPGPESGTVAAAGDAEAPTSEAPAAAAVAATKASPLGVEDSDSRVQLAYTDGRWRLSVVSQQSQQLHQQQEQRQGHVALQQQQQPQHVALQQQQSPHLQQFAGSIMPLHKLPSSPPAAAGRLLQHQQQGTRSPIAAAVSSSASAIRTRYARHSHTSSGCSEAALQLEQQLLGVFDASTGGSSTTTSSSFGGAGTLVASGSAGGDAPKGLVPAAVGASGRGDGSHQQPQPETVSLNEESVKPTSLQASIAAAGDAVSIATAEAAAGSMDSPLSAPAAIVAADDVLQQHANFSPLYQQASGTAAAQPRGLQSFVGDAGSSSSSVDGEMLLDFIFNLHELVPCDLQELKWAAAGLPTPAWDVQLNPNKLLLQLNGDMYTLPARPPPEAHAAAAAAGAQLTPAGSGDEWIGVEGLLGFRQSFGGQQQLSGHLASISQQQQLYRWMLSNSTGILDSLDHSYDEGDPLYSSRDSSTGGSSSALGLLGAFFSRRSPQPVAPAAAVQGALAASQASPAGQQQQQQAHSAPAAAPLAAATAGVGAAEGVVSFGSSTSGSPLLSISATGATPPAAAATVAFASSGGSFGPSGVRHRRTGSSTATSTAAAAAAPPAVAASRGHRRSRSVSSSGPLWMPGSPTAAAQLTGSAAAAATAAAAAAATASPAAAAAATGVAAGASTSPAASTPSAAAAAGAAAARPSSSLGGSSGGAAAAAGPTAVTSAGGASGISAGLSGGLGLLQRGFLAGFSLWDRGPGLSDSGDAGLASDRGSVSVERQYEMEEFIAATRRLISLHQKLSQVQDRRDRGRLKVEALLDKQVDAQHQQLLRHAAAQKLQAAAALAAVRQQQLSDAKATLHQRQQQLLARCQELIGAAGVLSSASARLRDAAVVLEGPEGLGRWKALHSQLVARRNRLACQLGDAFQVGPASKSPFAAAPLALQLDASWWAVDPDTAAAASGSTDEDLQQPSAAVNAAQDSKQQQQQESLVRQSQPQQQQQQTMPAAPPAAVDRLLVGGLELPSSLSKRGLQGSMGWGGDLDEEARVAAALGYVAHIVHLLSVYLDVPLRYPLVPRSSRSFISDPAPVHLQGLETNVHKRFWGLGHSVCPGSSSSGGGVGGNAGSTTVTGLWHAAAQQQSGFMSPARGPTPPPATAGKTGAGGGAEELDNASLQGPAKEEVLQLPLFYLAGDRTRFAYAVFLLNKDVEQLLHAHGMSSTGPSQVLANLYKLITAAASGLPQQQHQPSPRRLAGAQPSIGVSRAAAARTGPASSAAAAEAAVTAAGTGAAWLKHLPLPPGHRQEPQKLQQQHRQQQQQQLQPQQQQQGFWRWPWQNEPNQLQQQQRPPHSSNMLQQQPQQQPAIVTWDWNQLLAQLPDPQEQSVAQQQQQQQQQQRPPESATSGAAVNGTSHGLASWQADQQRHLQAAQQAAAAAEAAKAAAEAAAAAAARLLASQGQGGIYSSLQQVGARDDLQPGKSLASLWSMKWSGDD